jgi:hypothetical protein
LFYLCATAAGEEKSLTLKAKGLISVMLFESRDSLFRNFKLAKAEKNA